MNLIKRLLSYFIKPIVITEIQIVEKRVEVPVEKPVIKIVEKEVIKEIISVIPVIKPLRWWDTEEDFVAWVKRNELRPRLVADSTGRVEFARGSLEDCDDYAERLVKKAEQDGFRLMEVPVANGQIFGKTVTGVKEYHIGTWTKIQNVYYYAEATPGASTLGVVRVISAD